MILTWIFFPPRKQDKNKSICKEEDTTITQAAEPTVAICCVSVELNLMRSLDAVGESVNYYSFPLLDIG